MVLIGKYLIITTTWLGVSFMVYKSKNKTNKMQVMSCRKQLKRYDKINAADKDSIF